MFEPAYPLSELRPASYNPRQIGADALTELCASLRTLGLVKPIIVTCEGTLVAGHQRTKGMKELGFTHCPAFVLAPVNLTDEIRFNQLHNASDLDAGDARVSIPPQTTTGFVTVPPDAITAPTLRVKNAAKKSEILRLLSKYGAWGSCVATPDGEVLVSGLYALCCKILGRPCLVYVVPEEKRSAVLRYFGQPYGQFHYEHLPKTTWAQSLAQMMRIRDTDKVNKSGRTRGSSRTYENLVIPLLRPGLRVLDFGAGQMDYVKRLRGQGVDIIGIEFYLRAGRHLNTPQVHRDIDALCQSLAQKGLFDLVVCDSVLNSVDSLQAESDVLTCLAALCRTGGTVVFSGRSRWHVQHKETSHTINTDPDTRYVHFIDQDGFSGMYASGVWRYQKFHDLPEIARLTESHIGREYAVYDSEGRQVQDIVKTAGWGVVATMTGFLTQEERESALGREFDLPLPGGKSFQRGGDIVAAYRKAQQCTSN